MLSRTIWDRPRYALRTESEKFIYDSRSGEESLFDLRADPKEARDRRTEDALKAAFYRETLHTTVARLLHRGPADGGSKGPTCEECENLKALGYLDAGVKCPCN